MTFLNEREEETWNYNLEADDYLAEGLRVDYVLVFAVGTLFGFIGAWIVVRLSLRPSRAISEQYGALDLQLRSLNETAAQLQRVLADRTLRGKWGEQRLMHVLELAGFERDKDFRVQQPITTDTGQRYIPDFTFEFPNNIRLHLDSKFPLENYEAYLSAPSESERKVCSDKFLGNARNHVRRLSRKGYSSAGSNTLGYVILFVPFESIFRFIHESDSTIIDYALEQGVVICSPLTLYVLLATIRQSLDAFAYSQSAGEIRQVMGQLQSEWDSYESKMEQMGKQFRTMQSSYDELITLRRRQLERMFAKVDEVTDKYRTFADADP